MLELSDLSFSYDPSRPIVRRLNARFIGGDVTAVTGPSGTGKSTLLYLIGLMLKPTSG